MSLRTTLSQDGRVLDVQVSGAFNINQSLQMQDYINSLESRLDLIRIDLEQASSVDASIFSTLLLLHTESNNYTRIEVINCDMGLARRLSLMGLDRMMTVRMSATADQSEQANTDTGLTKDQQ